MWSTARALGAWLWTLLILVGTILVLSAGGESLVEALVASGGFAIMPPVFTAMGALIFRRQPSNRIGWILLYVGFGTLMIGLGDLLRASSPEAVSGLGDVLILAWSNSGYFIGLIFPLIFFLHLYPTGKVMGPRWRWGPLLLWVAVSTSVVAEFLSGEVTSPDASWAVANPIGLLGVQGTSVVRLIMGIGFLGSLVGGLAAITVRFRRSTGVIRQQIKWVTLSLVIFVLALLADLFFAQWIPRWMLEVPFVFSIVFIPVSIAIAIIRYRLFDIDRLLSRTVGYALVIAILAFVYVGGAVWLPTTLIDGESPLFVAASTLVVAALFNPLRRRIISWVDRRFYRARYDSERVVEQVAGRIRDETDLTSIVDEAVAVVAQTMQPDSVGVWLREPDLRANIADRPPARA